MKKSIILRINRTILTIALCLSFSLLFAQEHNLKTELLVYIMPDSLELPVHEKGRVTLQNATIKSPKLEMAIKNTKATTIARAFPAWTEKEEIMTRDDGKIIKAPPFNRIFTLTFDSEKEAEAAIDILKKSNAVVFAEKHSEPVLDNDEHYLDGSQWYLNNNGLNGGVVGADINAEGAWAIYTGNQNNTIAIIDVGVELTHEDLTGKATGDAHLGFSHGTQVAGVAAARANNELGIRGVDWNAQILSKRIWDTNDQYLGDAVAAQKITDAINEGATVLNCSWSFSSYSSTLALAFAYAYKMNRVSVATMGNTYDEQLRYPSGFSNVIAVGATQNDDTHSPFSTTGSHIDVAAPGGVHPENLLNQEDIFSTTINNGYEYTSGTSFSAPQVSGLSSLLKGFNSNLANDDIRQIIRLSADDRGAPGFDNDFGFGRINAGHALEMLQDPFALQQFTATSGNSVSSTGTFQMVIMGASDLASSIYLVKRYEVQKIVTFPGNFLNIESVWARGSFTTGWNLANPNFGEGFCEIVPGTLNETGMTLRTYVYQVWSIGGSYLGYYPSTPANATFAYTVLGIPEPTLSGADLICYSGTTYTIVDPPANTTIIWGGTNVSYPYGNTGTSVTVRASSSSTSNNGTVTASFTVNNIPYTITHPVWVGNPSFTWDYVNSDTELSPFEYGFAYPVYAVDEEAMGLIFASTDWSYTGPLTSIAGNLQLGKYRAGRDLGAGSIRYEVANTCGSTWHELYYEVVDNWYLSVSPNPATDETTLTIESVRSEAIDISTEWDFEIYDQMQILKTKKVKLKGNQYKINTSGWQGGMYFVRIKFKDKILSGKFLVNR